MSDLASRWLDHKKRLRPCPFSVLPEMTVRPKYVVHESDIDELVLQITALRAEIERLRAGGCARDQTTTQYCAEAARLAAENEKLRAGLREAFEVYANSEGFIHETAAEGYQQQIIKQMVDCINAALQDKSDKSPEGKAVIEREHETSKP